MSGRDVKKAVPVLKVHDGAALTRLHLTEEHSQLFLLALEAFLPSRADSSAAERDYGLGCPSTIWVLLRCKIKKASPIAGLWGITRPSLL